MSSYKKSQDPYLRDFHNAFESDYVLSSQSRLQLISRGGERSCPGTLTAEALLNEVAMIAAASEMPGM